jgi:hypothetical protein
VLGVGWVGGGGLRGGGGGGWGALGKWKSSLHKAAAVAVKDVSELTESFQQVNKERKEEKERKKEQQLASLLLRVLFVRACCCWWVWGAGACGSLRARLGLSMAIGLE